MKILQQSKIIGKSKKRIGRGYGSGKGGHTVGKGTKGQRTRTGYKKLRSWIRQSNIKSLPKLRGIGKRSALRGYVKSNEQKLVLNLNDLDRFAESSISIDTLKQKGLLKGTKVIVKILGKGEVKKKLIIRGIEVSQNAKEKIVKAGGKVIAR